MDIAFAAIFSVALILTIYSVVIIEDDAQEKSWRPVFILAFAAVAWITSAFLLGTPAGTTISYPAYTVNASGQSIMFPAFNVTAIANNPLPGYSLLEYGAFAFGMATLCGLFLALYMIQRGTEDLVDIADDIANGG